MMIDCTCRASTPDRGQKRPPFNHALPQNPHAGLPPGTSRLLAGAAFLLLTALAGCGEQRSQPAAAPPASSAADSWALLDFIKVDSVNPIMGPSTAGRFTDPILEQPVLWEEKDVFNPAVVVKNGQLYMLYRAENVVGKFGKTSRIGLATSSDGCTSPAARSRSCTPITTPTKSTNGRAAPRTRAWWKAPTAPTT